MRRLLFLSLALSFAAVFGAAAQSLDAFKRQLAEPAAAPGLLFSDNGPEAREGAFAARKLFEETFPGVKVCMGYDIPYFKVSVGNCLTTEEAIILKERVSATFPKAFVKNETLSIADLLN